MADNSIKMFNIQDKESYIHIYTYQSEFWMVFLDFDHLDTSWHVLMLLLFIGKDFFKLYLVSIDSFNSLSSLLETRVLCKKKKKPMQT